MPTNLLAVQVRTMRIESANDGSHQLPVGSFDLKLSPVQILNLDFLHCAELHKFQQLLGISEEAVLIGANQRRDPIIEN